jgi:hypothetical protein
MAAATARRMDWSAQIGLKQHFGEEAPKGYREFLEAVAEIEGAASAGKPAASRKA